MLQARELSETATRHRVILTGGGGGNQYVDKLAVTGDRLQSVNHGKNGIHLPHLLGRSHENALYLNLPIYYQLSRQLCSASCHIDRALLPTTFVIVAHSHANAFKTSRRFPVDGTDLIPLVH